MPIWCSTYVSISLIVLLIAPAPLIAGSSIGGTNFPFLSYAFTYRSRWDSSTLINVSFIRSGSRIWSFIASSYVMLYLSDIVFASIPITILVLSIFFHIYSHSYQYGIHLR